MLRYFTVLGNVAVAVVFGGIAAGRRGCSAPVVVGGATLAIVLVGVVYALLLRGLLDLSGGAWVADVLLHWVTPVLAALYWLGLQPKRGLGAGAPLLWLAAPALYFAYALVRGAAEGRYAYPFLEVDRLGWGAVLLTAGVMAAGFLVAGYGMVWLDRVLPAGADRAG